MKDRLQNEENLIKKYQSKIEQLQREMNVVEQLGLKSGDRFNDNEKLEKFNDLYYCYNLLCQEINRLQTALDEANERLARSVEFPCKVGDKVIFQDKFANIYKEIRKGIIIEFKVIKEHICVVIEPMLMPNEKYFTYHTYLNDYNKTWFTDKNKALEVLKGD